MKMETFSSLAAVLRSGTLAGAARILHLTPSAVSIQMKQLELYMGQQLFDRSGLEVKPLPIAFEMSAVMQKALEQLELLKRDRTYVVEGHVRLGIIESMQPLLLPDLTRIMRSRYPALHLQIQRGKSAELTHAVKAGELDAAVVAQPESGGSSRMHWHFLQAQELALVVPPDESEQRLTKLFQRYDWIRYDRRTIAGRLATRYVNHHIGPTVQPASVEFDGVRAILAMVSAGLGVSVVQLTEPGIHLNYPVRIQKLHNAPVIRFALVMRKPDAESRPLETLQSVLSEIFDVHVQKRYKSAEKGALIHRIPNSSGE
ncbi:MAG: LysR family transcriptional regulator [Advenella sp.]